MTIFRRPELLCGLLLLSACHRPGQELKQWPSPYHDARVTLTDINGDQISDYLLCGYAKKTGANKDGNPITDSVIAIDGHSGKQIWGYQTGDHLAGYPTVYKDLVYLGSSDKQVYALDLKTGQVKWKYTTGGAIRGSVVAGYGLIYFGSRDGVFYALDGKTGHKKWGFKSDKAFDATAALYNGIVYAPSWDGYLYALNAKTGTVEWKFQSETSFAHGSPVIDRGVLYIGSWDHHLYALNAQTGQLKWKFKTRSYLEYATPTVYEDTVFVGSNDKYFYALDRQSGKLKWAFETGDAIYATPAISDLGVYFSSRDGYLYALDFFGDLRWKHRIKGLVHSSPALASSDVLIGSPEAGLLRLYDNYSTIHWGMYGGDPGHRNNTAAATEEGEILTTRLSSSWFERRWKKIKSALK